MSAKVGSLNVDVTLETARFEQGLGRMKNALGSTDAQVQQAARRMNANMGEMQQAMQRINPTVGSMRSGMQQLGFQLNDVATQFASGTRPMQIFAQQGSQIVQSIQLMSGGTSKFAMFMGGPWGIALTAGTVVLGGLISKLTVSSEAMKDVQFATSAVGDAQGILGNIMDLTTGKVNTQSKALQALAQAQLLVARVQAQTRAAEARRGVQALQERGFTLGGGFGGGFSINRRKADARDTISKDVLGGTLDARTAVTRLENLRRVGKLTDDQFATAAASVANLGLELENIRTLDKVIAGDLKGAGVLKPGTPRRERAGSSGGGDSAIEKAKREREEAIRRASQLANQLTGLDLDILQAKRANLVDVTALADNARKQLALQTMQDFQGVETERKLGQINDATAQIYNGKIVQAAREKALTIDTQALADQARGLRAVQDAMADGQVDMLRLQEQFAVTDKERRTVQLQILDAESEKARQAQLDVLNSKTSGDYDKQIATLKLAQIDAMKAGQADLIRRDTEGPLDSYLRTIDLSRDQMDEALQGIAANGLHAFNDGIVDALINFKSLGDVAHNIIGGIAADLLNLAVQKYITGSLASLLGLSGGGSPVDLLAGTPFGGARALGGPVNAGIPYLVGERGPELIVPRMNGHVIPNHQLGGSPGGQRPLVVHNHFPGISSAKEAREAGGQAARRLRQELHGPLGMAR